MSTNTTIKNINFQGADLGRAYSEGTLCGPGAIELPGCLAGPGCKEWSSNTTTGNGVVENVIIQNIRLSDAVLRGEISQMNNNCKAGEALNRHGQHVPAHQISVFANKLPDNENQTHRNVLIDNLVAMNSRADGLNIHGAVTNLTLSNGHIENSGDDCIGIWSTGINNMLIENMTLKNCAVSAGVQNNWGSCIGTYAFQSVTVKNLNCYDPFESTSGCPPRTHWTAIHVNKAFDTDCMPMGASLSLSGIEYYASVNPLVPLNRSKCGQCKSCCGSCTENGFDNLSVVYVDDTVVDGSCKGVNAGC